MSALIDAEIDIEETTRRAFARQVEKIESARTSVDDFIEYTGTAPDGGPLVQEPVHREMQRFWKRHRRTVLLAPVGIGKSTQVRGLLTHMIGNNPDLQILYFSATERHPIKQLRSIATEIETNDRIRHVFPHLRPGDIWASNQIQVARKSKNPDPTIQIFGAFTQSVLGSRANVVVFDDLCNDGNTLTEHNRDRMSDWVAEVISRLMPGAIVIAIGHIWHQFDQLQRWSRIDGWHYKRFESTYVDKAGIVQPLSPSILNLKEIEQKRSDLGPVRAAMMLDNRIPSFEHGRFRQTWFEACLKAGRGLKFVERWFNGMAFTGVDLGHRKKAGKDLTVMFTAAILPDGSRQILDIRSGLWKGPEIIEELSDVHRRFGSIIAVENNGAQQYILDFAEDRECFSVSGHHTGASNKHHMEHGVEALGLQLAQARWRIPCDQNLIPWEDVGGKSEVQKAINACLSYDPKQHTPDHLMAWWICSEAMRQSWSADDMPKGHAHDDIEELLGTRMDLIG